MKAKEILRSFTKGFFVTLVIGLLSIFTIILLNESYKKYKDDVQKHQNQINDIQNQIKNIGFYRFQIAYNQYTMLLGVTTVNRESAENITKILRNANIFADNKDFKVQLQLDKSINRNNLISIAFDSGDTYNSQFIEIIDKLNNSEYIDSESREIQIKTKELSKTITKESTDDELEDIRKKTNTDSQKREIKHDDFAEFVLICQKNQKLQKDFSVNTQSLNVQTPLIST